MDYIWVAVAFICGFLVKQINLPPLVGYLAAGFGLHAWGIEPDESLETLADLGIALLLFTIGLKLNIKSLFKTEIWGSAAGHMFTIVALTTLSCFLFSFLGISQFIGLDLSSAILIGFAVSFSSTVCAVKILENRGEMRARHAQIAIGILIIQDIAAVLFVSFATDITPTWWAFSILTLPLLRPVFDKLLQHCGHGEVLLLAGFFLAITGGELFKLAGLESHLGALAAGVLLSGHTKATELTKSLLGFKDLFLIGFFLSIGFTALPTVDMLSTALILAVALPIKAFLFFLWLTGFKLRSRSAFLAALSLTNYSEFGLIVCSVSVSYGLLTEEWLIIMALAVTISFIFSSIINAKAHIFYSRWHDTIIHLERSERLPEDQFSQPDGAIVLVVGMGRVGTGAYDTLIESWGTKEVCGVDVDRKRVNTHCSAGRNVIAADAEDPDFWTHTNLDGVKLVMLAMPNYLDILEAVKQLKRINYQGKIAGIARYEDQKNILLTSGIDVVFNYYNNVGSGFAEHSMHLLDTQ